MKRTEIVVGGVYFDGKMGVRRVIGEGSQFVAFSGQSDADCVHYQVLGGGKAGGRTYSTRAAFASWAQVRVAEAELAPLLVRLTAESIKLPARLRAFVRQIDPGERALVRPVGQLRLVSEACYRGLVANVSHDHRHVTAELTDVGVACVARFRSEGERKA